MFVRRTLTALATGAVLACTTAAAASADAPAATPNAADRALHVRSAALNRLHGDAATRPSRDALNALAVRSEALNSYGQTLQKATPVASTPASTSFAWDDFGTGMAAAFGLVLLMGGLVVALRAGTRRRVRIPS
jgi:hypothetical protein